ncbi:unnamed protein product [Lactuca virosa]|uniref:Uncharacterized protein n=1 Tax=Lactuca virosa TaxID=75947 RepID=A0AAU9LF45_9ASTR|nr:unnamed protein product [Lactuca virosa]
MMPSASSPIRNSPVSSAIDGISIAVILGSSDVSKSEGPRSGVNLVDSLLDAGCDAISIENKGLGLSNGSEGAVMGSKISSKVVMADIARSPMVNHVIRNPIKKEDGVI